MRKVGAVIAGVVSMFVIVIVVEMFGPVFHPIPAGMNPNDSGAFARWVATAPLSAQAVIVAAWFLGALGGGWIALRISGWVAAAWIVALIDAGLAIATILRFEHPLWMQICAVVAPLLGGWIATRLAPAPIPAVAEGESIDN